MLDRVDALLFAAPAVVLCGLARDAVSLIPLAAPHLNFLLMKRIAILGSTGSIGRSTLSVVETYPELFQVIALAAGQNVDTAFEQARRWKPQLISMATDVDAEILRSRLQTAGMTDIEVVHGQAGTVRVADSSRS